MAGGSSLLNIIQQSLEAPMELAWERGIEFVKDTGHVVTEAGKESVGSIGLDMKASFTFTQSAEGDVAKTPELAAAEAAKDSELNRVQSFFAKLNEDLKMIQDGPPIPQVNELTVKAALMGQEERNDMAGYQPNYGEEHTHNNYVTNILIERLSELEKPQEEKTEKDEAPVASALNAATEGASGSLNPELQNGPQASLSANAGG